jgi:methionyl-tRNA formyltransferase
VTRAVVFAYSEVGVRCVRELLAQGIAISILFTHADDPHESQWFGSVKQLAETHGLRVETPDDPNAIEWIAEGRRARPDFVFSFYYRHLLNAAWLALPRRGALNMHGSLLPKYRGRAPVHWAIIHGETVTGASLHYMVEKPDAGALVDQQSVAILENDTALAVSMKVAEAAQRVLERSVPKLIAGTAAARAMDLTQGSYFGRRRPEDGRIDWRGRAQEIHNLVRAVAPPFPGAFTEVNGCRLLILETRLDPEPVRYATQAPCLYAVEGQWYADCADGKRLKILQLAIDRAALGGAASGRAALGGTAPVTPADAPPALSNLPLALTSNI